MFCGAKHQISFSLKKIVCPWKSLVAKGKSWPSAPSQPPQAQCGIISVLPLELCALGHQQGLPAHTWRANSLLPRNNAASIKSKFLHCFVVLLLGCKTSIKIKVLPSLVLVVGSSVSLATIRVVNPFLHLDGHSVKGARHQVLVICTPSFFQR